MEILITFLVAIILGIAMIGAMTMAFAFLWVPYKDKKGRYIVKK
jgi:hypothetical protein